MSATSNRGSVPLTENTHQDSVPAVPCPRCGAPMFKGLSGKFLLCPRAMSCPCFITIDDGKVHFGRDK